MIPINSNRKLNSISVWYLDILKARDVLNHPSIFYLLSLNQLPLTVKHQNAVLKNRWTEHIWLQSMRTLDHRCQDNGKHQPVLKRALTQCCTSQVQPLRDSLRQTESSPIRKAMRSDVYCSRTENCVCAFIHWTESLPFVQLFHSLLYQSRFLNVVNILVAKHS